MTILNSELYDALREGGPVGLDHSGLYSNGRLIHGHSIYGPPGDNFRRTGTSPIR